MKNIKKVLTIVPMVVCSIVGLGACGQKPHEHSLLKTDATPETCITAGNSTYYTCADCGKFYSDSEAKTEITQNSWIINATGHAYTNDNDKDCNNGCGHVRETAVFNMWDGSITDLPAPIDNTYTITTAEQLAKLAELVCAGNNFENYTFNLTADIDLKNIPWKSIGYGCIKFNSYFSGTFNGNNHTIYNVNVSGFGGGLTTVNGDEVPSTGEDGTSGVGLFGSTNKATIKNLKINNIVANGNHYVGGLVGYALDTDIDNCHVTNAQINCLYYDSEESGDKAGVVAGSIDYKSLMTNCTASNGSVVAGRDAGFMVGCASISREDFAQTNSASNITVAHDGDGANTNIVPDLLGRLSGV